MISRLNLSLLVICVCLFLSVNGVLLKLSNGLVQGYSEKVNGVEVNVFKVCFLKGFYSLFFKEFLALD